jgi:hypothetical protein
MSDLAQSEDGEPRGELDLVVIFHSARSALTDCMKLVSLSWGRRRAIVIYGFDHENWPLSRAIEAFEALASSKVRLLRACLADFIDLVHPYHSRGRVVAWEIEHQ